MPKQILKLTDFHGGLNNNSDPRDLEDNQLSHVLNVMVDNLGKVRAMGQEVDGHEAHATPNVDVEPGYGLFVFNHDRTCGHIDEGDLTGTATSSDSTVGSDVLTDSAATWTASALIGATVKNTTDGSSGAITANTDTTVTVGGELADYSGSGDESFDNNDAYTITDFPSTGANYIALADADTSGDIYIYSKQANGSGWGATRILNLGSTTGMKPCFYFTRGALRVSDGSFANSNKWWGYVHTDAKSVTALEGTTEQAESNLSVSTWVSGDQTLLAPDGTTAAPPEANKWLHGTGGGLEVPSDNAGSFVVNTKFYAANHFGTNYSGNWDIPETGDNPSNYYLYCSYVYDNGQESSLNRTKRATGIYDTGEDGTPDRPWEDKVLWFDLRISNRGNLVDKRIKGINFYWNNSEASPSERYLLAEYDLERGLRVSGETEYKMLFNTGYNSIRTSVKIRYKPMFQTYKSRNGYNDYENVDAKFKTAVVANNVAYIGNVEQNGVRYPDAIFKSPPGKFDVFPESRKIEVVTADGDEIIKLETHADRILQFKKEKLQIINIAQQEFLESTHKHKGILIPAASCKTDFGVAWVNRYGCYFYTGEQVVDLLEPDGLKLISTSEWESFTTDNSIIGYLPKKRQLIVLKDCTSTSGGDIFIYDFPTKSWVFGDSRFADSKDRTNFVTDWNGDLLHMYATSELMKWSDTATGTPGFQLATKDIDFGSSGLKKKVYKVKVTYKGDASSLNVMYGVNGETDIADDLLQFINPDTGNADNSPLADKSSTADMEVWHVADLKPNISSEANNIYSIRLVFSDSDVGATFQIKDVSIIYRMKSIK